MSSRPRNSENDFRRRPQLTNADMGTNGTSQKAPHQDRSEAVDGRT